VILFLLLYKLVRLLYSMRHMYAREWYRRHCRRRRRRRHHRHRHRRRQSELGKM
jgi:hypothetical protein